MSRTAIGPSDRTSRSSPAAPAMIKIQPTIMACRGVQYPQVSCSRIIARALKPSVVPTSSQLLDWRWTYG